MDEMFKDTNFILKKCKHSNKNVVTNTMVKYAISSFLKETQNMNISKVENYGY